MGGITAEHIHSFHEEGYMIVPGFFSKGQLELMRAECTHGIDDMHRRMDEAGTEVIHISHRGSRYFINHQTDRSPALHDLAFSQQMAELCRATIGDEAYFFLDQYVVKCSETGLHFSWHQDAGYITHQSQTVLDLLDSAR